MSSFSLTLPVRTAAPTIQHRRDGHPMDAPAGPRAEPATALSCTTTRRVTKVAEAVARLGNHTFPLTLTDTVRSFLGYMSEHAVLEFPEDDLE